MASGGHAVDHLAVAYYLSAFSVIKGESYVYPIALALEAWRQGKLDAYGNRWVALHDGDVVAHAETTEELKRLGFDYMKAVKRNDDGTTSTADGTASTDVLLVPVFVQGVTSPPPPPTAL